MSEATFFNLPARGIKASRHMQHNVTKDKMEKTVRCESLLPGIRKQGFWGVGGPCRLKDQWEHSGFRNGGRRLNVSFALSSPR